MFSLCEKYGGKRTYPLPVFAEKDAMPSHAAPVAPVTLAKPPKKWQAAFPPSCQHMPIHPPSQQRPCSSFLKLDNFSAPCFMVQLDERIFYIISDRGYCPHTGNYNSSTHSFLHSFCYIAIPPSTHNPCPVMYFARSDAKNTTASATSSTVPNAPSGIVLHASSFTASESLSVISVAINPGATAFTVIPRDDNSFAVALVRPITPALEAE